MSTRQVTRTAAALHDAGDFTCLQRKRANLSIVRIATLKGREEQPLVSGKYFDVVDLSTAGNHRFGSAAGNWDSGQCPAFLIAEKDFVVLSSGGSDRVSRLA